MIVTLAEMKIYLGIDPSNTSSDVFLTNQIAYISEVINGYCARVFEQQTYVQTYYPGYLHYSRVFETYQFPVTNVASIKADGNLLEESDYRIHKPSGTIMVFNNLGSFSDKLEIEFTAGFTTNTMPVILKNAVYALVQERYNKNSSGVALNFGADVQRISIPGTISIDFDYTLTSNERSSTFGVVLGSQANMLDFFRSERAILNSDLTYVEVI